MVNPVAPGREKLVETKQRWAQEGRLLTGVAADPATRLPPGQRLVTDFPVLDLGVQPDIARAKWHLRVDGLVANRLILDWSAFEDIATAEFTNDIHCVTAWSRYDNRWRGVGVQTLLDRVQPAAEVSHVVLHSFDGYTTNLSLDAFARAENLVASHWNGAPLERVHGGPARLVVPHLYFWKSAKWLSRIELVAEDRPGFWEMRGYHNNADPWTEERYG